MKVTKEKHLWTLEAMTTATGTYNSEAMEVVRSTGFASVLVISTAGSLELTFEVSDDGTNFYTVYDADDNDLSGIHAAVTVTAGKWIQFPVQIARYMRIKAVLTGANSTVSVAFRQTEEI